MPTVRWWMAAATLLLAAAAAEAQFEFFRGDGNFAARFPPALRTDRAFSFCRLLGGFLWVDDFWGTLAWQQWTRELAKVLPPSEYPIEDVPLSDPHPLMSLAPSRNTETPRREIFGLVAMKSGRVIFVDLARALAVILMVVGHTSSALLAPDYRSGPWFDVWVFQRGLTSALFLLLSGFAFSLATTRHWTSHLHASSTVLRRVRRFVLFVILGYALHFPVLPAARLATVSDAQFRSFVTADVLQLIGISLLALQALVFVVRSRRAFMVVTLALAAAVIAAAPGFWRTDWTQNLPLPVAAYLSPATGSQFPLFPWVAYVFIGAGAGQLYARWGAAHLTRFANRVMLAPGAALIAAGLTVWSGIAGDVALRTGSSLLVLAVIAYVSRHITQLPHLFGAVAQESLVVYFVHLCVIYGSIWNAGLSHFYGEALSLATTALVAVAVVGGMVALAWQWNRLKHMRPVAAHRISVAAGVVLAARLL